MLKHKNLEQNHPERVVVLGGKGFVGGAAIKRLLADQVPVKALSRDDFDLLDDRAAEQLASLLRPTDILLIACANAPCKDNKMLFENIKMMKNICDALGKMSVKQVIYISSDAVYTDSMEKLNESSPAAPQSLHGVMHLARELMLASVLPQDSLLILRPSLLYGANDPHNGYGPNSFYRLAANGNVIKLFGNGEEQRDHVYIEDVAEIIYLCCLHQSYGVLNITTGEVVSFNQIAQQVSQLFDFPVEIQCQPRVGAMPHNGYRAFDNANCRKAFPDFRYTPFSEGVMKVHEKLQENSYA